MSRPKRNPVMSRGRRAILAMCALLCIGQSACSAAGPKIVERTIRVPVQPPICLRLQPPHRPAPPSCQLDQQPCADEYTAALLDWALKLEAWSALAWTSCKGSQP